MNLQFNGYSVTDTGVEFSFDFPTGEMATISTPIIVTLTDAELAAVTTQVQLRNALVTKLQRKIQKAGIASKLDQFINQTITI
jgi:hypothetical protein